MGAVKEKPERARVCDETLRRDREGVVFRIAGAMRPITVAERQVFCRNTGNLPGNYPKLPELGWRPLWGSIFRRSGCAKRPLFNLSGKATLLPRCGHPGREHQPASLAWQFGSTAFCSRYWSNLPKDWRSPALPKAYFLLRLSLIHI